jgi:hypothetical protein
VDLRLCFSGRPWRRGEERVEVGVPFWLRVVLVVFFVDVAVPAGRGGEGSCVRRWCGARGGGPRWRGAGWKMGGGGERLLWPCSFSEARIRPSEADSFCGHLQVVAASSSQRQEVRRRHRRLGVWGKCWI